MQRLCEIDDCGRKHFAKGLCKHHYNRLVYRRKSDAPPCSIGGCSKPLSKRGWCDMHYRRWLRHGDPLVVHPKGRGNGDINPALFGMIRFLPSGCWEWTGGKVHGYGQVSINGRSRRAHRVVYEYLIGPIPAGLVLDHTCRNKACVNPKHLEPITNQENIYRGWLDVGERLGYTQAQSPATGG